MGSWLIDCKMKTTIPLPIMQQSRQIPATGSVGRRTSQHQTPHEQKGNLIFITACSFFYQSCTFNSINLSPRVGHVHSPIPGNHWQSTRVLGCRGIAFPTQPLVRLNSLLSSKFGWFISHSCRHSSHLWNTCFLLLVQTTSFQPF